MFQKSIRILLFIFTYLFEYNTRLEIFYVLPKGNIVKKYKCVKIALWGIGTVGSVKNSTLYLFNGELKKTSTKLDYPQQILPPWVIIVYPRR